MRRITALLFFLFFACAARAEILIGVAGPMTGQNAAFGNELRSGATAAVTALNVQGGINGETLAVVEGDDACDAKRAVEVAKTFVSKDVRMVIGHFCTSASVAAATIYNTAGILMLNPAVTSDDLTSKNLWNIFRLTGRDDAQAEISATRIKSEKRDGAVFLITDGQAETANLVKRFLATLPNATVVTVKAGNAALPDEPALIVASAIYLALQAVDAADVSKAIRKLNAEVPLYGPDLLQSENFASRAEVSAEGTRISFLIDNSTLANAEKLVTLPKNEGATLASYAAVEVFAAAAKARNVNDSRAMASWLSSGNAVQTIIGALRFDARGDLQAQPYTWFQWKNGTLAPEFP